MLQRHAAVQTAVDRGHFAVGKIHARPVLQKREQFLQRRPLFNRRIGLAHAEIGMFASHGQLPPNGCRTQYKIDHAGSHRAERHTVECGAFILGKGDAAGGLDGFEADGAVRGRAGENDANRAALLVLGERGQKVIDGQMATAFFRTRSQHDHALENGHLGIGRDHINMVRLDFRVLSSLLDGHLVWAASKSARMLSWFGSRCWIMTKPIPVVAGRWSSIFVKASRPPAEAPTPTTGQRPPVGDCSISDCRLTSGSGELGIADWSSTAGLDASCRSIIRVPEPPRGRLLPTAIRKDNPLLDAQGV